MVNNVYLERKISIQQFDEGTNLPIEVCIIDFIISVYNITNILISKDESNDKEVIEILIDSNENEISNENVQSEIHVNSANENNETKQLNDQIPSIVIDPSSSYDGLSRDQEFDANKSNAGESFITYNSEQTLNDDSEIGKVSHKSKKNKSKSGKLKNNSFVLYWRCKIKDIKNKINK